MQAHPAARGDGPHFVEVLLRVREVAEVAEVGGAGEEAAREVVEPACKAKALYCVVQMARTFRRAGRMGTAEREMIEGDMEPPVVLLGDPDCSSGSPQNVREP